ncbi:MAG: hypothetical protein KDE48_10875 [Anaerolineales bacterium]|nr:hypothetical protein [Anaerolineales bacterium]
MKTYPCPDCEKILGGQHNFCPYCGYDFRGHIPASQNVNEMPTVEPDKPDAASDPITTPPPPSLRPQPPTTGGNNQNQRPPKRIRFIDLRTIIGIFGILDILILILLGAWFFLWPGVSEPAPQLACEQLVASEFVPPRFESGIKGELDEDTLFLADTEYLIQETLSVPQNRRLLIEPGAVIKFDEAAVLEVHGGLFACGSPENPISFTSDSGKADSWQGIRFLDAADSSTISHALVQFAGLRAISLENSAPTLADVKIVSSAGFPISSDGNEMPHLRGSIEFERNAFDALEIRGGKLSDKQNITWPNQDVVYVISGPITVGENTTLSIDTQTTLKFWQGGRDAAGLIIQGLLKAEEVQFTSIYDSRDEVGGPTYVEAQDPAAGDWVGISFQEGSSKSYIRDSLVQYAGRGQAAIAMQATAPELTGVTIADSAWYPLSVDADAFPTLQDLTLLDNDPGDALEVRGKSSMNSRNIRTWQRLGGDEQIVRIVRGDITIEPETTLVIEPGVIIKFEPQGRLIVKGTLDAVGGNAEDEKIIFTSLRDDEYGGQTDKNSSPQDERHWQGVYFENSDDSSVLQNVILRYGFVILDNASPRLIDNLLRDSESAPLWATPDAAPTLQGNQLQDNGLNGIAIAGDKLTSDHIWAPLAGENGQLVRILTENLTITENATLQIGAGTIIKADTKGKITVNGGLRTAGEAGLPVIFTSLHDDGSGGNTNQQLQEPHAGDWQGIELGRDADAIMGETDVRFAQDGLFLRDGNAPRGEGIVRLLNGINAVRCNGDSILPDMLEAEGNEVNDLQCPHQ